MAAYTDRINQERGKIDLIDIIRPANQVLHGHLQSYLGGPTMPEDEEKIGQILDTELALGQLAQRALLEKFGVDLGAAYSVDMGLVELLKGIEKATGCPSEEAREITLNIKKTIDRSVERAIGHDVPHR
jgi:hypothetical protein